jgi:uncharacterized phiE125 gp8 family phage protein
MAGKHIVTPPAVEPILLAEAKLHLRALDTTEEDSLISAFIIGAREACEAFIRGQLITQTWQVQLDAFPNDSSPIKIPVEPLQSVTSVTWADQANNITTMTAGTDFLVDTDSEPGRIVLPPNNAWPGASLWPVSPIKITVVAGFGVSGSNVPELYKRGMLLAIGHWYENREAVSTSGAIGKEIPMTTEYMWWLGGRYWHNF